MGLCILKTSFLKAVGKAVDSSSGPGVNSSKPVLQIQKRSSDGVCFEMNIAIYSLAQRTFWWKKEITGTMVLTSETSVKPG